MMSTSTTMHAHDGGLEFAIDRSNSAHGFNPTLRIRCGEHDVTIFINEEQLMDLAAVVSEAADAAELSCGTCHGDGELTVGFERDTRYTPGDPINIECASCEGLGSVTAGHLREELGGAFPDEDTAIEDERCAMMDATGTP